MHFFELAIKTGKNLPLTVIFHFLFLVEENKFVEQPCVGRRKLHSVVFLSSS